MFKKFAVYSVISVLQLSRVLANDESIDEFEKAWTNPDYIQYQANDIDINEILAQTPPYNIRLSGEELWEAEKRKAFDPLSYIPDVVQSGMTFEQKQLSTNEVTFMRFSEQRSWKDRSQTVNVLEEVHLFEDERKAIFLGRPLEQLSKDIEINNHPYQDLFHVEHSVGGSEENPKNLWRIVFLINDLNYKKAITTLLDSQPKNSLPIFVQKFIEYKKNNF